MIKSPDPISDSDDFDTTSHSNSNHIPSVKHSKGNKYKPKNKSKNFSPKTKNTMQRSSLKKSPSLIDLPPPHPLITTPQLPENTSPLLLSIFYTIIVLIIFHLVIPINLHCLLLLIYKTLSLLKILISTTPPLVLPYTMYGIQPNLTHLVFIHHLWNLSIFL